MLRKAAILEDPGETPSGIGVYCLQKEGKGVQIPMHRAHVHCGGFSCIKCIVISVYSAHNSQIYICTEQPK